MFKRILLRFHDMKTIGKLIPGADKEANMVGEEKPGAEHFILAALNLEDGTAKRTFERFEIDSEKFREAIKKQYEEALSSFFISQDTIETDPE
ncbi:MAG: Clp protease N-terminal domain-containing protein, partial [Candidatus Thiodiazotropha sp. 6PDIVS]